MNNFSPHFILILHETYKKNGFFNVKVYDDRYFGEDKSIINIFIENNIKPIEGKISRNANNNKTARIFGRVNLKNWFKTLRNLQEIKVTILNKNSIKMEVQGEKN